MRGWYARRGVAWAPLLTSCALGLLAAATTRTWTSSVAVLLHAALALCAAAAGFVFDEGASSVVAVTPRGSAWRRTTRFAVSLVPLATWGAVVALVALPDGVHRIPWLLAGAVTLLVVTAAAATASRAGVPAPGSPVAAGVALAVLGPHLMSGFLGWDPLPLGPFPTSLAAFWLAVALAGLGAAAWALRPGLR